MGTFYITYFYSQCSIVCKLRDSHTVICTPLLVLERAMEGKKWKDILIQPPTDDLICPETHDLLIDPYLAKCGHHVSKTAVDELLKMNNPCSRCITNVKAVESEPQPSIEEDDCLKKMVAVTEEDGCCGTANVQNPEPVRNNAPKKETFGPRPDRDLRIRILAFDVRCPLENRGCTWAGQLKQLEKHLGTLECQYVETICPYNCGNVIRRGLLEKHKVMYCTNRPFTCPFCNNITFCYDNKKIRSHLAICAERGVECPENCGEPNIKLHRLKEHLYNCPNELTSCEYAYAGCNVKVLFQSLDAHYKSSIEHHYRLLAKYCDATISRTKKILAEDRQIESLQMFRICANYPEFKMEDYLWHETNSDPWYSDHFYTNIPGYKMRIKVDTSKAAGSRVAVQVMQGEFDSELKFPFHGEVVIELIDQDLENVVKQKSITDKMNAFAFFMFNTNTLHGYGELVDHSFIDEKKYIKCNRLVLRVTEVILKDAQSDHKGVVLDQLQEHIEHSLSRVEECSYCYILETYDQMMLHNSSRVFQDILAPLSIEVHAMIRALEQQRHVLNKVYSSCKSKPAVFQRFPEITISNFQHYYKHRQYFRSKPFYTHFGGYKMHLKVDGYGSGKEKGGQLCVAVVLMKGPFDDKLKFPFQGEITVQLIKDYNRRECTQSKFVFSSTTAIKIADRVTDAQHQKCYENDNGLVNDKFVSLNEVKMFDRLTFKVAKVVVGDECSISSDNTDTRLALQLLYVQEKSEEYMCMSYH